MMKSFLGLPANFEFVNGFTKHIREFARAFRNHRIEFGDGFVEFVDQRLRLGGEYSILVDGRVVAETLNLIPTAGLNYLLSAGVDAGAAYTTWYINGYTANVSPTAGWVPSDFVSTGVEMATTTHITNTTRPVFDTAAPSGGVINNFSNPGTITSNISNLGLYGLGVLSNSAIGNTTGVLLSAGKLPTAYTLPSAGNTAGLRYQLTATPV